MIRFAAKVALAYLAERLVIKPEPTSAESVLRWRMTLLMMDMGDAFRPAVEAMRQMSQDFMEIAERMEEGS